MHVTYNSLLQELWHFPSKYLVLAAHSQALISNPCLPAPLTTSGNWVSVAFEGMPQYSILKDLLYREGSVLKQLESFHTPAPVHECAALEGGAYFKESSSCMRNRYINIVSSATSKDF